MALEVEQKKAIKVLSKFSLQNDYHVMFISAISSCEISIFSSKILFPTTQEELDCYAYC